MDRDSGRREEGEQDDVSITALSDASHSCSMNHTIPRGHLEVQTPEDTWRSTPRAHLEDHRPEAEPNP